MSVLEIAGCQIRPGERKKITVPIGRLYDSTQLEMPVEVIRGIKAGPTIFISAAIHGDELNGIEIVRQLVNKIRVKNVSGTIIAVPIVNIFGFNMKSRYLPDRRDLNRSFPGAENGSLASRIAFVFRKEIVEKCDYGIDLHTGAIHRSNYPQIRANLKEKKVKELALAFGADIVLDSDLRDGSLRSCAKKLKVPVLLFEGGQALRFEPKVINAGKVGCLNILYFLKILSPPPIRNPKKTISKVAKGGYWVRSTIGGTLRIKVKQGQFVAKGAVIGEVLNPFGVIMEKLFCKKEGHVIGISLLPLVNVGDAVVHIATLNSMKGQKNFRDELVVDDDF